MSFSALSRYEINMEHEGLTVGQAYTLEYGAGYAVIPPMLTVGAAATTSNRSRVTTTARPLTGWPASARKWSGSPQVHALCLIALCLRVHGGEPAAGTYHRADGHQEVLRATAAPDGAAESARYGHRQPGAPQNKTARVILSQPLYTRRRKRRDPEGSRWADILPE